MKKNILRVAICAALVAGVGGCGFSGEGNDPRLERPGKPTPEDLLDEARKGLDASLWIGKVIAGPVVSDEGQVTCTGCVREVKPNSPIGGAHLCVPPCTPAQIASEQQDLEQGVAVMRAMLAAHHRGVELKVVLPAPTQPE